MTVLELVLALWAVWTLPLVVLGVVRVAAFLRLANRIGGADAPD